MYFFFEDICNIPHPSYKEDKISNYLVDFAKSRNLEYYQDTLNNVIIIKEASKGYEDIAPIILQGHMDMVCEKRPDVEHDFTKDGLNLSVEGDYVSAKRNKPLVVMTELLLLMVLHFWKVIQLLIRRLKCLLL